jgi:hypothetical protein
VYCSEVEAVLHAHPHVAQAAAFGVPHPLLGELVAAACVLRPGASPAAGAAAELVGWCRERLAHYKVPARVHLLEQMPATGSGKVLKTALREMFGAAAGAAGGGGAAAAAAASVCGPAASAEVAAGEVAARVAGALPWLRLPPLAEGERLDGQLCHVLVVQEGGGAAVVLQQVGGALDVPAG